MSHRVLLIARHFINFWPMRVASLVFRFAASVVLAVAMSGCLPASSSSVDEEKDPHYINGRNRASGLDFRGAIDEYEKALENNPHNSAAHRELGFVYGEQMKDHAAAIYHLQQYLKYHSTAENAELIKGWIRTYKTELVKTDFIAPMNLGMQRDLERLTTENANLKRQVEQLSIQLGSREVLATNIVQPRTTQPTGATDIRTAGVQTQPRPTPRPEPVRQRTHTVKAGDTVSSIAKELGVKINSLLQANPGVDPRRLKPGQTLNVPTS
jgi:LysM repeat protein